VLCVGRIASFVANCRIAKLTEIRNPAITNTVRIPGEILSRREDAIAPSSKMK
jgi:hypothetical protein